MNWTDQTVLVTGAGGFIGSHLTERLVEGGARTRALIRYSSSGSRGWLEGSPHREQIEFFLGDLCDPATLKPALKGVDVVFHLAALIGIPYSYQAPSSYVQTNVQGSLHLFEQALEARVGRVVHTSTSEVYGTARTVPIEESHPLQGQSPYSASKIGADKLAEAFHLSFGLPVVTVRPFNTFGPRQSARAVIPTIILQCLEGSCVKLGNLGTTRDFNYVSNTVDAFLAAAQAQEAVGRTIHFGSGREISIAELARQIGSSLGRDELEIISDDQRIRPAGSEVERLLADSSLAERLLGWQPRISLEEGLQRTTRWWSARQGGPSTHTYAV